MFPSQPAPYEDLEKPKRKSHLIGCFIALGLLAVLVWVGIHFLPPILSSKPMKGEFLNAVAIPSPAGGGHRLWVLTDGSFIYIQRTESPGRISVGRKCMSCKTWLYVYDPVQKTVLAKFRMDYKALILYTYLAYRNGKVWVASGAYDKNDPQIFVYSAEPPGLIAETPAIIAKYPELGSGLIDLRMAENPERIIFETKDGRKGLVLTLGDEKFYPTETEYRNAITGSDEEQLTVFSLGLEDNGPRKRLYKVTGPKGRVKDSSLEFMLRDPKSFPSFYKTTCEPVTPDRVYIEGVIFYQDADCCLVLHQDAAGQTANRLLTCVSGDGKEKWTTGPADLFKEMNVDLKKRSLSAIFFMKNDFEVSRTGSLVMLQLKGVGIIGFDFETGRKLWELKF
jgi:hypothetical protein